MGYYDVDNDLAIKIAQLFLETGKLKTDDINILTRE